MTDSARAENRILAEMTALALAGGGYVDAVNGVLNLLRQAVSSPFLSLSIREMNRVGFYMRGARDVDPLWLEELGRQVEASLEGALTHGGGALPPSDEQHIVVPAAWISIFSAQSRSGRSCAVTLGSPRPFELTHDEEEIMVRFSRHALLALDHALLLEQAEQLETVDPLTGLANHRRLLEILEYEMRRHRYLSRGLALVLLDIEGLERINRSFGHQYGNHILGRLGALISDLCRPIDVVARSGMDEFVIVLPEVDEEEAQAWADQLREKVVDARFAGGSIGLTVASIHCIPDGSMDAERFLYRGEQMLHDIKRQERGWNARVAAHPRVH